MNIKDHLTYLNNNGLLSNVEYFDLMQNPVEAIIYLAEYEYEN